MAKRNGIIKALIQIGLILVVLALIFFSLNSVLPGFIDVLANGQQSDVQEYLNSFHDFSGYAIGFLLQFIQIITIALPSVPIQVAVGVIFGTWRVSRLLSRLCFGKCSDFYFRPQARSKA